MEGLRKLVDHLHFWFVSLRSMNLTTVAQTQGESTKVKKKRQGDRNAVLLFVPNYNKII